MSFPAILGDGTTFALEPTLVPPELLEVVKRVADRVSPPEKKTGVLWSASKPIANPLTHAGNIRTLNLSSVVL